MWLKIPSDGNTPDFGGGLQHHLRDFAHHPTIVGNSESAKNDLQHFPLLVYFRWL